MRKTIQILQYFFSALGWLVFGLYVFYVEILELLFKWLGNEFFYSGLSGVTIFEILKYIPKLIPVIFIAFGIYRAVRFGTDHQEKTSIFKLYLIVQGLSFALIYVLLLLMF